MYYSVRYMWFVRTRFIISTVLSFSPLRNLKSLHDMQLPITPSNSYILGELLFLNNDNNNNNDNNSYNKEKIHQKVVVLINIL